MAIINMNQLFDKLQEYIDKKIAGLPEGLEELFIEYGLKNVADNLPVINTVANAIIEIKNVAHNISDVINCSDNMAYIKAAPQAAQDAIQASQEAVQARNYAYQWSSNPEDILVNDGINPPGYSAYHWAQKANDGINPELFYRRDGTQPLTDHFQANQYQLKNVANGSDLDDAVTVEQNNLKANLAGATFAGAVRGIAPVDVDELTRKDYVDNLHSLSFERSEHVEVTSGTSDTGKPVILDSNGVLDVSLIPITGGFEYQGQFTPTAGTEYPDTAGLNSGAFWDVNGVDETNGYTFTGGNLTGEVAKNGDQMIFSGDTSWSLRESTFDGSVYMKLDGTTPMAGNLSGGSFIAQNFAPATTVGELVTYEQITGLATDFVKRDGSLDMTGNLDMGTYQINNIADGIQVTDAASLGQVSTMISGIDKGDIGLEYAVVSDTTISGIGQRIVNQIVLTQTEYDTLTPDTNTFYIISGA